MGKACLRVVAGLYLTITLSGCLEGTSDIDVVKEGRFDAYPEFKIGETFDNRTLCESTTWSMIKDSRGRDLVDYRCEIKGVNQYYQDKLIALVKRCEESLNNTDPNPFRERLNSNLEVELKKIDELRSKSESATPEGRDSLKGYIRYHEKKAAEITARLEELSRWEKNKEANNRSSLAQANRILAGFNTASAYEYFRWSVTEDDTFMLVDGGIGLKKPTYDQHRENTYAEERLRKAVGYVYADSRGLYAFTTTPKRPLEISCK